MNETRLRTVAQLGAFLDGNLEVKFQPIRNDVERYGFIAAVLGRFACRRLVPANMGDMATLITSAMTMLDRTRIAQAKPA